MKKYTILFLTALMLFTLIGVSCRTPPPAVEELADEALGEITSRVEQARRRAMDFEAPAYFPSEWEAAEAQFAAARELPVTTQEEVDQAAASLSAVADLYDEIFRRTVPLYAQAREDEIMAVREQVVNSSFSAVFPGFLRNADDLALEAYALLQAEDFYAARDKAAEALREYELLAKGARVFLVRQEIIERNFQQFDMENFERADEIANTAVELYEAGDDQGALANAEEALLRFNVVLNTGWAALAGERRESAVKERELAIEYRVNVAMREEFRQADTVFNRAEADFRAENFNTAASAFMDAEVMFAVAREETEIRRLRAQETIRQAEEAVEASSEAALEAERIIEGGLR